MNNRRTVKSILLIKKILRLVEMMSALVNASFSLPKWQNGKCTLEHLKQNCPLRTLEMAFQSIKISKYSMGKNPQTPIVAHPVGRRVIH